MILQTKAMKNIIQSGHIFQVIPLFHLIRENDSDERIDKIYLFTKDFNEPKYQL